MKDTKLWDKRYQELKDYKRKQGDTNVPRRYEPNTQLGVWVSNQRQYYKKFKTGISGWGMTESRINRLEKIGFEWVLAGGRGNVSAHNNSFMTGSCAGNDTKFAASLLEWDKMYDRLVAYRHQYGNTNVPKVYEDDQNLANWVNIQKNEFKRYEAGMKCEGMTLDRFNLLLEVEFQSSISEDENNDEVISETAMENLSHCADQESGLKDSEGKIRSRSHLLNEGMIVSSIYAKRNLQSFDGCNEDLYNGEDYYISKEDNIFFEAVAASGSNATLDSVAEIIFQKFSNRGNST